ncbi:MAG TPA: cytochrome c3 family protein [Longimicrobiales bacterium]|nr:cytochrome c3 family protein [Longimicrobiales bacterium]
MRHSFIRTTITMAACAAVLWLMALPGSAGAQQSTDAQCTLCHGELELMRRHAASLAEARALVVSDLTLRASAHESLSCASCHTGFSRYPHERTADVGTESCTSCHEPESQAHARGVHAATSVTRTPGQPATQAATCADCHGIHDAVAIDTSSAEVRARLNGDCVACHASAALPPDDPHLDAVTCTSCHVAHDMRRVDDPASSLAPLAQPATCGACHAAAADSVPHDVHGRALAALDPALTLSRLQARADAPPTCSSCHGAHGMRAPSQAEFEQDMVAACGACHEDYSDTYFGTYHGKATTLGSEIVATCNACHGAHAILPADEPASHVSDARLIQTCGACHPHADAKFVLYDSHPDPWDRERNPPLFYSFIFMNAMLFGVVGVFTLHTALWWLRLWLDRRKGEHARAGGDHV